MKSAAKIPIDGHRCLDGWCGHKQGIKKNNYIFLLILIKIIKYNYKDRYHKELNRNERDRERKKPKQIQYMSQ